MFTNLAALIHVVAFWAHCAHCGVNLTVGSCIIQYLEVCGSDFVKFYISSSDYPEYGPHLFTADNITLPWWVAKENDYKLVIHGYGGGTDFNQTKEIQREYLKRKSTNIIAVDWGLLAPLPCYPTAAVNTKQAGECIASFLMKLTQTNRSFFPERLHIIGFSLGAHVAAFTSNALEKISGRKIERITGLDPALPFFATSHKSKKLDATDADFVDVIHTNVGVFGKIETSGHVDFYVNGGQTQPSCNVTNNIPLCSHMLANVYFKESITSAKGFWGVRCSSYFQYLFGWCGNSSRIINSDLFLMGEHCPITARGIIFVYTNYDEPYAMGKRPLTLI